MKLMNEKQAWLYMASRWDAPKKELSFDVTTVYTVWGSDQRYFGAGMCANLSKLHTCELISRPTYLSMGYKISERMNHGGRFMFALTINGAKRRAAFFRWYSGSLRRSFIHATRRAFTSGFER